MTGFGYACPKTVAECVDLVRTYGTGASFICGGTDVMVDLRSGELQPEMLIDVNRLPDLQDIYLDQGMLHIGAGVRITQILESEEIQVQTPVLGQAAKRFASPQIRNVASIGGNVGHCSPCADTLPPLLVHEAKVHLVGPSGRRKVSVREVAAGPYRLALDPRELIVGFELVPRPGSRAGFAKIGRRKELAIARINMAGLADQDRDGRLHNVRFALGSCTPVPGRFPNIEALLEGSLPTRELLWEAGGQLASSMIEITGRRPSFVYKEKAVQGLLFRMFSQMVHHD